MLKVPLNTKQTNSTIHYYAPKVPSIFDTDYCNDSCILAFHTLVHVAPTVVGKRCASKATGDGCCSIIVDCVLLTQGTNDQLAYNDKLNSLP